MNITTQFGINDPVWVMYNNKALMFRVSGIDVKLTLRGDGIHKDVTYCIVGNNLEITVEAGDAFPTKEALLETL
jgi:hypothetical protein